MLWVYLAMQIPLTIMTIAFAILFHNWNYLRRNLVETFGGLDISKLAPGFSRKTTIKESEREKGLP
jgi:hypothetical protein